MEHPASDSELQETHLSVHDILPVVRQAALDVCPPAARARAFLPCTVRVERTCEREVEGRVCREVDQVGVDLRGRFGQLSRLCATRTG